MDPLSSANPTAQAPQKDNSSSEGRCDPHGIAWTRGAPPIDAHLYVSGDFSSPVDMIAASKARKTDSNADGTGVGRRASGFRAVGAGTLVFVTGAGNTETWALQAGEGDSVEITTITSWSGSDGIRVYF